MFPTISVHLIFPSSFDLPAYPSMLWSIHLPYIDLLFHPFYTPYSPSCSVLYVVILFKHLLFS
ncbi:hypothetical protein BJ165DRAFT_1446509 [Panaeolus papilionaceus]|nr:hypothetical protein BJ165DRAFT_1446509 [Panaeolus papilionaceus]